MATEFTPVAALFGGLMIGLSAVLLLATTGRIAGISGLTSAVLPPVTDRNSVVTAAAFVVGLVAAPMVFLVATGAMPVQTLNESLLVMAVGGLAVGFGTVTGNGCTSGHGVCGLSRLSMRSLVATLTFMATAVATVAIVRHAL